MQAFFLGIIQGITEFIPISSTAHLRIIPEVLDWEDPGTEFSAVIQLGTLIAVFIYFRNDLKKIFLAAIISIKNRSLFESSNSRTAWGIIAATFPIVIFGLIFKDFIKNEARELWVIGISLILVGLLIYISEKISKKKQTIADLNFFQIQFIGLTQVLSLIPGCSRSGSTIMGGFFMGLNRENSARFSFLLGFPAIFGSSIYEFYELIKIGISIEDYFHLAIGIISAFFSGYISIKFFLSFIKSFGTFFFVLYRVLLGTLILVFLV